LLAYRVEVKVAGKRINDVLNRIHIAQPKARDNAARPPVIPPGVAEARAKRAAGQRKRTQKDIQEEKGGAGVYAQVCEIAGVCVHELRCGRHLNGSRV
jgi:nucleolar GTP-binding protein